MRRNGNDDRNAQDLGRIVDMKITKYKKGPSGVIAFAFFIADFQSTIVFRWKNECKKIWREPTNSNKKFQRMTSFNFEVLITPHDTRKTK